jgi:membrane protein DedA with SNARE-associated domain
MLGFRFIYGVRLVTALLIGIGRLSAVRFAVLNAIGVLAWASVVASAGYIFGHLVEVEQASLATYDMLIILTIAILGLCLWLAHRAGLLRRDRNSGSGKSARIGPSKSA